MHKKIKIRIRIWDLDGADNWIFDIDHSYCAPLR
jgi:hypothetical protein